MTTTIAQPAIDLFGQSSSRGLVDAVVAIVLIGLLVGRELTRAVGGRWRDQVRAVNTAAVPLLMAFTVAVAARLARLL